MMCGCVTGPTARLAERFPAPPTGPAPAVGCLRVVHLGDPDQTQGTGFLIDSNILVTCYHVVNGAQSATITFPSGQTLPVAGIVAESQKDDLALLRVEGVTNVVPLRLATQPAQVGDEVVLRGYPLPGEVSQRQSAGRVLFLGPSYGVSLAVVTSADSSHGFSGGPALNAQGEVVGFTMAGISGMTVEGEQLTDKQGFLVPASSIRTIPLVAAQSLQQWTQSRGAAAQAATLVSRAQEAIERGDRAISVVHLEAATQLDPHNVMAWYQYGMGLEALGREGDALKAYRQSLALNPMMPEILCAVGNLQRKNLDAKQAVATLEQAVAMSPGSDQVRFCLGVAYLSARNADKADEQWLVLARTSPAAASFLLKNIQDLDSAMAEAVRGRVDLASVVTKGNTLMEQIVVTMGTAAQKGKLTKTVACKILAGVDPMLQLRYCQFRDADAQSLFASYLRAVSGIYCQVAASSGMTPEERLEVLNLALAAVAHRLALHGATKAQKAWMSAMTADTVAAVFRKEASAGTDLKKLLATPSGTQCVSWMKEMEIQEHAWNPLQAADGDASGKIDQMQQHSPTATVRTHSTAPATAGRWTLAGGNGCLDDIRTKAEKNDAKAQCQVAICYQLGVGMEKDDVQAFTWYKRAAEQNSAEGQSSVGMCYAYGIGVSKDLREGIKWWHKAAQQNYAEAQCALGFHYANGLGVDKDASEAIRWWRKAAEQNHAKAQYYLATGYQSGMGVASNAVEAASWFRKSAEQDFTPAQSSLAACCATGIGVAQDPSEAVMWVQIAVRKRDSAARQLLLTLTQQQPEAVIVEGKRRAQEWLDRHKKSNKRMPSAVTTPGSTAAEQR